MSLRKMIENQAYTLGKPQIIPDPVDETKKQAASGQYKYLLAHADDGVIWGIVEDKALKLSSQAFSEVSPAFRKETLRELRLFGAGGEWFAWRGENDKWKARIITDGVGETGDCFDEKFILWGTESDEEVRDGFQIARESDLGIRHAPPLTFTGRRKARLVVRHYLDYDPAGAVYVKLSRLVDLENGESA